MLLPLLALLLPLLPLLPLLSLDLPDEPDAFDEPEPFESFESLELEEDPLLRWMAPPPRDPPDPELPPLDDCVRAGALKVLPVAVPLLPLLPLVFELPPVGPTPRAGANTPGGPLMPDGGRRTPPSVPSTGATVLRPSLPPPSRQSSRLIPSGRPVSRCHSLRLPCVVRGAAPLTGRVAFCGFCGL